MKTVKEIKKGFGLLDKKNIVMIMILVIGSFLCAHCKNNDNTNVSSDSKQANVDNSEKFSELKKGLDEKFKKSSNAIIKSITEDKENYSILLEKDGYGADGDLYIVAIDVAVTINKLNSSLDFKSIRIKGEKEEFVFTKEIYEKYKSGQINDSQFKSLSKSIKLK